MGRLVACRLGIDTLTVFSQAGGVFITGHQNARSPGVCQLCSRVLASHAGSATKERDRAAATLACHSVISHREWMIDGGGCL